MPQWLNNFWKFLNQPDPNDVERVERWMDEIEESERVEKEMKKTKNPHFLKSKQKLPNH